jgi:hypothetical protein
MSDLKLVSASLALLFTAAAAAGEPAYQPFPKGYGYLEPAEIRALQLAVKTGDNAVVREHGWRLWAGVMQPAAGLDWPVWTTWPNTTNAFAGGLPGLARLAQSQEQLPGAIHAHGFPVDHPRSGDCRLRVGN